MTESTTHDVFMQAALREARLAMDFDEVPVGAVIVAQGRIIAKGHNQTERLNDVTAHAEMIALTAAAAHLGSKYLKDCTLYVTLEPCVMCAAALRWAQLGMLVFGAADEKAGFQRMTEPVLHPRTAVLGGIRADISSEMLQAFFQARRKKS